MCEDDFCHVVQTVFSSPSLSQDLWWLPFLSSSTLKKHKSILSRAKPLLASGDIWGIVTGEDELSTWWRVAESCRLWPGPAEPRASSLTWPLLLSQLCVPLVCFLGLMASVSYICSLLRLKLRFYCSRMLHLYPGYMLIITSNYWCVFLMVIGLDPTIWTIFLPAKRWLSFLWLWHRIHFLNLYMQLVRMDDLET